MKRGTRAIWRTLVTAMVLGCITAPADAQVLYSFESDLQGWGPPTFAGSHVLSVTHSTVGASEGTHSMAIERGRALTGTNAFSWDASRTTSAGSLPDVYQAFQSVAAEPVKYALDFDVTLTPESFADVTSIGPYFLISAFVNGSVEGSFDQVLNLVPVGSDSENLIGVNGMGQDVPKLGTHHFSIPLSSTGGSSDRSFYLAPDSTFYQLNIGSNLQNTLFQNGPGGEGAVYFVDNIRFRRLPDLLPETLFSWETPDNSGTPTVNEQHEGWVPGFQAGHAHSITPTGATDGNSAFNIHRVYTGQDFTWGSQFVLASDSNPDPEIEETDPVIQQRINDLTSKIEAADRIAIDVTFDPASFDASPTYARFGLHVSDTANFFQASFPSFNPLSYTEETTLTIEMPVSALENSMGGKLVDIGFAEDPNFFRIGISTSVDGLLISSTPVPIDFQIDNFRLITEVFPLEGDYNADGAVDAADYVVWRKTVGSTIVLPNDPDGGTIGPDQYATWRANFGTGSGGSGAGGGNAAAPEPSGLLLIFMATVAGVMFGRGRE